MSSVFDVDSFDCRGMKIDAIGGFDARGFILGPPVALALGLPFFMLRKKVSLYVVPLTGCMLSSRFMLKDQCAMRDGCMLLFLFLLSTTSSDSL